MSSTQSNTLSISTTTTDKTPVSIPIGTLPPSTAATVDLVAYASDGSQTYSNRIAATLACSSGGVASIVTQVGDQHGALACKARLVVSGANVSASIVGSTASVNWSITGTVRTQA